MISGEKLQYMPLYLVFTDSKSLFYYNEIQRGYGGIGSYTLSPEFEHAAIAVDEIMSLSAI